MANSKRVKEYLQRLEIPYQMQQKPKRFTFLVRGENFNGLPIEIALTEKGKYICFSIPQLVPVKDHVYKGVVFQTLLTIALEQDMIRWGYNPGNGYICASVEMVLEDSTLTFKQFKRCLRTLLEIIDQEAIPRLRQVLATGSDPGIQKPTQLLLEELPPEFLAQIQKMSEDRN